MVACTVARLRRCKLNAAKRMIPVELLSSRERHLTPPLVARKLVDWIRRQTGSSKVAALYVAMTGPYVSMPGVEPWPMLAQYYHGPWPVVCHPPCGPWGKTRTLCKYQDKALGPIAISQVHLYGGIVEHPVGSTLFEEYGRPGAVIHRINQGDYGHRSVKPTLLYVVLT